MVWFCQIKSMLFHNHWLNTDQINVNWRLQTTQMNVLVAALHSLRTVQEAYWLYNTTNLQHKGIIIRRKKIAKCYSNQAYAKIRQHGTPRTSRTDVCLNDALWVRSPMNWTRERDYPNSLGFLTRYCDPGWLASCCGVCSCCWYTSLHISRGCWRRCCARCCWLSCSSTITITANTLVCKQSQEI